MASQATSTKGSVLDYSLDVFGFAYDGERVGQAMLKLLPTIQELVSAEELETLTQEANRAAHHDFAQPPPKANRKTHPLRAYVDRAPLYCAFSVDRREEFPEPVPELLALGQALAILEAVSPQVTSAQQRQITTFLHQLPSKSSRRAGVLRPVIPASLDGEEIKRCLDRLPEMVGRGIEEARLKEYKVILDGLYAHVTGERVKRAQPKKRRKFSSKQGRKISRKPLAIDGGHWGAVPAKDPSDDSNKLEPSLATGEDLLPTDTEAKAKTFNLHGHNLRFNRMYAGQSTEAFSPAESALAMKELLVFHPETPGQSAARLIWVLVGMFGRLFDDLGLAIMKPHSISDEDGEILDFRRIGNVFEIDVRHVLASKLPVLPPQILVSACSHTLTLKVRVPDLPDLEVGWQFLKAPSASLVDDRINELLEEKIKIRRWVRKREVSRFTETRLRGGLVQAVFSQDFDLPKTQLMFSEAFESSLAALHYLSWKNSDIQRTLSRANLNLYSASVTDQPEANSRRVGADKSQIDPENFKEASRRFNTSQRRLRKLGAARWRDRHELLVQTTVHALGAGAGHRFTEDLASLTLNDLSLEHGLGLFRDKPADSSAYRRLAVIPSSVIQGLYRYLEHLQFLEKDTEHGVPEKVKNYARCALEGDIPLFWYLAGDERLPPQPRLLFKELLSDDNIEPNCYRHAASTGLRELGASPLLVEMHLGHSIREPLLGKEGLISPKDLATELRPFLDKLFDTYGYEIPKYKGAKFVRQPVSREQFHILNKNEADRDRKLLLGQLKSAISSSPLPKRNQCIDEAIANVVPGFDGKTFPPGTNVGKDETRKIRDNLISVLSGNFLAIYRACKDLRRKLRLIAETSENCSVEILPPISWDVRPPLPITRAHILAADQFAELERQFISACEKKNTDKALLARTALVLWGNCPTFKEAEQWLIVFERTPVIKGEDFQIIELGNGVSRTISGSAYQICLAWLAAKSPKPAQTLTSIFGEGYSQSGIEGTVTYSAWIRFPGVLAQIVTGKIPCKELSRERLLDWIYDRPTIRTGDFGEYTSVSKVALPSSGKVPQSEAERLFKEMRNVIPVQGYDGQDPMGQVSPFRAVQEWRENRALPSLIALMSHWAEILLGPHANKKTGGTLHPRTVRSYLYNAWVPLNSVFSRGVFEDLEADELTDILVDAISQDRGLDLAIDEGSEIEGNTGVAQALSINRFFQEMQEFYDIPQIQLPVGGRQSAVVDAGVFTISDGEYIQQVLELWSLDESIEPTLAAGLKQANDAIRIISWHGVRPSEVLYSRNEDFIRGENKLATLLIRHHSDRTIKTPAGVRQLALKPKITFSDGDKRTKHHFDILVQKAVKSTVLPSVYALCRHTTQDTGSRLYRFRHSVGSRNTGRAIVPASSSIDRLRIFSETAANLGHARISITLYYYAHTVFFCLAQQHSTDYSSLSFKGLATLFSKSEATVRKKFERSRRLGQSVSAQLVSDNDATAIEIPVEEKVAIGLPDTLRAKSAEKLPLRSTLLWMLRTARNQDPLLATEGLGFSIATLERTARRLILMQRRLDWFAVEESRLFDVCGETATTDVPFNEVTVHHRRFPGNWIDSVVDGLPNTIVDVPDDLPGLLLGINLDTLSVPGDLLTNQALKEAFDRVGLPINTTISDNSYPVSHFSVETGEKPRKHDGNLTRLLLIGTLVHSTRH